MSRDDVVTEMKKAGLADPRVLPLRLREGKMVWILCAGDGEARTSWRVPADPSRAVLAEAINALRLVNA